MGSTIKFLVASVFVSSMFVFGAVTNANGSATVDDSVNGKDVGTSDWSASPQAQPSDKRSNYELLQGKWQNTDDKTNFLIFEKNHRKELAEGMEELDDEEFVLSDKCVNDSKKDAALEKEKDRYISLPGSDLCCYIIKLDDSALTISYVGRGKNLTYKRVK